MGKYSRDKGKAWEREVAIKFRAIYGEHVRRGLSQTRDGGEEPDVKGVPGFWPECKVGQRHDILGAMEQAIDAEQVWRTTNALPAETKRKPLGVIKYDRRRELAVLLLDDFLALMREREHMASQLAQLATQATTEAAVVAAPEGNNKQEVQ